MEPLPVEASDGRRHGGAVRRGAAGGWRRGKLTALVGLLRDHYDAVEADLQRFYGVDLADLWTGELSLRRLSVYVANLPITSATWAVENGLPLGSTPTDVLLADIYQAVTGQTHPLRPASTAKSPVAKARHESTAARLRAQRVRVAQQRAAAAAKEASV